MFPSESVYHNDNGRAIILIIPAIILSKEFYHIVKLDKLTWLKSIFQCIILNKNVRTLDLRSFEIYTRPTPLIPYLWIQFPPVMQIITGKRRHLGPLWKRQSYEFSCRWTFSICVMDYTYFCLLVWEKQNCFLPKLPIVLAFYHYGNGRFLLANVANKNKIT